MLHISSQLQFNDQKYTGKKLLYETLGIVKQAVLSLFSMALSCADLKWNKLMSLIAALLF